MNELALKALEDTPIQKINDWKENNFGKMMYAKRRWILNSNRVISSAGMKGLIDPKNEVKKDRKSGELSRRIFEKVA